MISNLTGASFRALGNIAQSSHMLYTAEPDQHGNVGILERFFESLRESVTEATNLAVELRMDATTNSGLRVLDLMRRAMPHTDQHFYLGAQDAERLCWALNHLLENFTSQIDGRAIFVVDGRNASILNSDTPPFGDVIGDAFPTSAEDLTEAAKCLALQRNTACVFHLMRAMEAAVGKLAEAVNTGQRTDKVWGHILSDIGKSIEGMDKGPRRDSWSECHSLLYHVKQAWRNDTMHPKRTYTDEQAEELFLAVRSFMTKLAPLVESQ